MSRHLFITGASSGIGRSLAQKMATDGWRVSAVARRSERLAGLKDNYPSILPLTADVTDKAQIKAVMTEAVALHGPIDLAVLNAGIYTPVKTESFTADVFVQQMQVNYFGMINCLEHLLAPMMARGRGHIALMGSVAGYRGLPLSAAYGPTKAAIQNLAESLYFDLQPKGVKLQLINPGFVETEATAINDFKMPDLITSDTAALHIINGLKRDEFEISFPKSFVRKMKLMRLIPLPLYLRLTAKLTGHH